MFRSKEPKKIERPTPVIDMDWVNFNRRALRGHPDYTILKMHNMYMEFEEYDRRQD